MTYRLIPLLLFVANLTAYAQSKILFSRNAGALNTGGTLDLMMYDPVKKTTVMLLKGTVRGRGEYNAVTSPDNTKIIFSTYRFSGWKMGVGDFDDETITNVKQMVTGAHYRYNAMYSPDGSMIAYQEYNWSSGNTDLFIADKEGKNVAPFIKGEEHNRTPDWLRDGKTIIFASSRGNNYSLYSKATDDGRLKRLTNTDGNDFAPSVSRVEDRIAFLSDREGKVNLYLMNADGSNTINITPTLKTDPFRMNGFETSGCWAYKTCWSGDGKQIVFNAMVGGNLELFIINKDGSGLIQITRNNDSDVSPYWMN